MLLICAFLLMLPTSEFIVLQVCRKGWMLAVGGTEKMHRTVLSCVLRVGTGQETPQQRFR